MNIYEKNELIKDIESISKMSIGDLLSQDDILDYIILLNNEHDGTMYSLKYDQQFVFLNTITDEFLNPKEMIEIIKNFNPGEEAIIKAVYTTTKICK